MPPLIAPDTARATAPAFSLNVIQVASPCSADWEAMTGDARARHCGECKKNVYNLSAMTEKAALALIREKEGHLCVRFFRRDDGTILTQDCPVGVRAKLRAAWTKSVARVAAAAVLVAGMFGVGCQARSGGAGGAGVTGGASSGGASAIGLEPAAPTPVSPQIMGRMVMGDYCPAPAPPPVPATPVLPAQEAPAPEAPVEPAAQ